MASLRPGILARYRTVATIGFDRLPEAVVVRAKQATPTPSAAIPANERVKIYFPLFYATPAKAGAHRPANTDPSEIGKVLPLLENLQAVENGSRLSPGWRRVARVKR
jgi:hypothetical protein